MRLTESRLSRIVPLTIAILFACSLCRAEHPSEHPSARSSAPAAKKIGVNEVADFITKYVKKKGRSYSIKHPDTGKYVRLKLDKVHRKRLSEVVKNIFFVCADFKAKDRTLYDLDFWVKVQGSNLRVTKTMMHKVNSKPRYTWYKDKKDGLWKQKYETPSIDRVAIFIKSHVRKKGRTFRIKNPDTGKSLRLTLVKVHRNRLSEVVKNVFFVCADFKAKDGKVYDLDFWVKFDKGTLKVTKDMLHKIDGKPRYTWFQDKKDGLWKQKTAVPATAPKPKAPEHPEHP